MRALFGCGTPREAAGASQAVLFVLQTDAMLLLAVIGELDGERGMLLIAFTHDG
jgi:hypothetical protein